MQNRIELDLYEKEALNIKLEILREYIKLCPKIKITYFQQDEKKDGGIYITHSGMVKKIDEYERVVIMTEDTVIPTDEIIYIEGKVFL